MKFSVFTKTNDQKSIDIAREFIKCLPSNIECSLFCSMKQAVESSQSELFGDYFICFGGDGTILRCALAAAKFGAKVFSVNTGNLGFLSATEGEILPSKLLTAILSNSTVYEEKIFLEGRINNLKDDNKNETLFYAFNEIAVTRFSEFGLKSGSINLSLRIKDDFVGKYLADGLMIATPSGSTAYSLSAGGAILTPNLKGLIATPICPHSLHDRPIVFSDDDFSEISLMKKRDADKAGVYADGNLITTIGIGEKVVIKKSNLTVNMAKGESFFAKLNNKLQHWESEG